MFAFSRPGHPLCCPKQHFSKELFNSLNLFLSLALEMLLNLFDSSPSHSLPTMVWFLRIKILLYYFFQVFLLRYCHSLCKFWYWYLDVHIHRVIDILVIIAAWPTVILKTPPIEICILISEMLKGEHTCILELMKHFIIYLYIKIWKLFYGLFCFLFDLSFSLEYIPLLSCLLLDRVFFSFYY